MRTALKHVMLWSLVLCCAGCSPRIRTITLGPTATGPTSRMCVVQPFVSLTRIRSSNDSANAEAEQAVALIARAVALDSAKTVGKPVLLELTEKSMADMVAGKTVRRVFLTNRAPRVGRPVRDTALRSAIRSVDAPLSLLLFVKGTYWAPDSRPYTAVTSAGHVLLAGGAHNVPDTTQSVALYVCLVDRASMAVVYNDAYYGAHAAPNKQNVESAVGRVMGRLLSALNRNDA